MRRIDQFRARRGSAAKPSAQALETLGLILIVVLILAITITRSWHHINWSTR
jgi:uncharacterized membrane protein